MTGIRAVIPLRIPLLPYPQPMLHAPSMLLFIPGHWEPEPEGVKRLRLHLSDEYGATLTVRPFHGLAPMKLCAGYWERRPDGDEALEDLIVDAFFTLDWLDEVL